MAETIYIIKLRGYGYKNGNITINKTIEYDNLNDYQKFLGANRLDEISRVISFHYPGVEFDPNKISVNTDSKNKPKPKKETNTLLAGAVVASNLLKKKDRKTHKKEFSASEIRRQNARKRSDERVKLRKQNKGNSEFENIIKNKISETLFQNKSSKKGIKKLFPLFGLIIMFLFLLILLWLQKN